MLEKLMDFHILLYGMALLGAVGAVGMLATHLAYRRMLKSTEKMTNLKEKWLNLWGSRDQLLHRMNRLVWYPAIGSTALFLAAVLINGGQAGRKGIPLVYLYVGAVIPVLLLLLRQGLDFSYREELIMNSLTDYVDQVHTWVEMLPEKEISDPVLQDEVVERITSSIRQTAATGSHFSRMLSAEEEEIMRQIIREFMN